MNPDCLDCEICQGDTSPRDHLRRDYWQGTARGLLCGRCAHRLRILQNHNGKLDAYGSRVAGVVRASPWRRWMQDHWPAIQRYLEEQA
jgi:hypothetical protein